MEKCKHKLMEGIKSGDGKTGGLDGGGSRPKGIYLWILQRRS